MTREPLSVSGLLNQAGDLVPRIASPWLGVLWLGVLPYRLLQVRFVVDLMRLGAGATHYHDYLLGSAYAMVAALVLATYARAFYARACALAFEPGRLPGREALQLPAAGLNFLMLSLLIEVALVASFYTVVVVPVLVVIRGLATATLDRRQPPGIVAPIREVLGLGGPLPVLLALFCVFAVAHLVALVNLWAAFALGLWLLQAFPDLELLRWQQLLGFGNPRFALLLVAGALLVVEPFWLAAMAAYARMARARRSGEDLRQWFVELTTGDAAS